eukprot:scaffold369580_cov101-Attheya_sp.AAC.1
MNEGHGLNQEIHLSQTHKKDETHPPEPTCPHPPEQESEFRNISPGGPYTILAPIFNSLSSLSEFDNDALEIAVNGLREVHHKVSCHIKSKTTTSTVNNGGTYISSSYQTSRGTISKLKKY